MIKLFLILFFSFNIWACPNCGGSGSTFDKYTIEILAIFIAATYIPMSILFRMAINKRKTTPTERNDC